MDSLIIRMVIHPSHKRIIYMITGLERLLTAELTVPILLLSVILLLTVTQTAMARILRSSKSLQEKNHRLLSQLLKLALLEQSSIEALNESEHYDDDDDEPDVHLLKDV